MKEPGTPPTHGGPSVPNSSTLSTISSLLHVNTLCMVLTHSLLEIAEIAFHRWMSVTLLDCNTLKAEAGIFNLLLFLGLVGEFMAPQ